MPRFTTRVELHSATADDYSFLHSAMELEGFSRLIENGDGVSHHLPTAEYNYDGPSKRAEVLEAAERAAAKTKRKYSILVTESNGRTWSGLARV
jgi:hypothetical protein